MKTTAKNRDDFWFFYRFIPRHIKRPDCKQSPYFDRFPRKDVVVCKYQMTLDDPYLIQLAQQINIKTRGKSAKYKAGYILKLVQMGYTYQKDRKTYGVDEKYQFPVCTSYLHIGDCEDGALLGVGLSKLCGLDAQLIRVHGHLAYGVRVNGFGCKFKHDGKKYIWCEQTSIMPIGVHFNNKKILGTFTPFSPPVDYIANHSTPDLFDKYKPK